MVSSLITEPGAYPDIDGELYHQTELCPEPSTSSTGLKILDTKSPAHFWAQHPANPNKVTRPDKRHFRIGRALHDLLLVNGSIPANYHLVPDGFNPAHTRVWAEYIKPYREAVANGMTVLETGEFKTIQRMAEAVSKDELANALLTAGTPEMTLAARDPLTGVWMRAKPDVLPTAMEIVPDVKTAIDASPEVYENAASRNGVFQSAAHYLDLIDLVFGEAKRRFVLITVEKTYPHCVVIDHLDDGDINEARMLNRRALNIFDRCLKTGVWPGYTTAEKPIRQLQMSRPMRARINRMVEMGELSYQ